jgi:molybdopterin/thiamine biosynthesis adenylyltransferase
MTRFDRHQPLLGDEGWRRLRKTPVVVAGVGGLGSNVVTILARLGTPELEIWDPGYLDEPDLNRQMLYDEADVGRLKVERAAERLKEMSSELTVHAVAEPLELDRFNTRTAVGNRGFVLFDCLDAFDVRAALAAIRAERGCPVFHGGVETWYGQVTTMLPDGGGYERAFGADFAGQAKAVKPIMPHVVATVAAAQVGEFVQWCRSPARTPLSDALWMYDGQRMRTRRVGLA